MSRSIVGLALLVIVMGGGLWVEATPQSPPTLAEFAAMAEAGRLMAVRQFVCDRGDGRLLYYGRSDVPTDQEWMVSILPWRLERPHAVVHYTPGADGYADILWIDQDGDGIYETVVTATSAGEMVSKTPAMGSPCNAP